jgi:hypothetical protein
MPQVQVAPYQRLRQRSLMSLISVGRIYQSWIDEDLVSLRPYLIIQRDMFAHRAAGLIEP